MKLFSQNSHRYDHNTPTLQTGRRTDRRTDGYSALCVASRGKNSTKITNSLLDMHHLTCGTILLLNLVNLILFFSSWLTSSILRCAQPTPHYSPCLHSHHLTPSAFHSRLQIHLLHKFFPPKSHWFPLDCLQGISIRVRLTGICLC